MKKLLSLMLASALMLSLFAACSSETEETTDTSTETGETAEAPAFIDGDYFDDKGYFKGVTASDYVTLDGYNDIEYPADVTVTEEEIDAQIDSLLSTYEEPQIISDENYTVKDGDTLNIDYVGSVDGVPFDGGSTEGAGTEVTIGVTSYIEGFLVQLIGHKTGENFDIDVTFPEDYHNTELAGKDAVFNITINSIIEYVKPELTDDFIKEISSGDFETVSDFTKDLEENILDSKKNAYLDTTLLEMAEISEIPTEVLDYFEKSIAFEIESMATAYGITVEDFASQFGLTTMEELIELEQTNIELNAKNILICQYIAEMEDISVDEEDINNYFYGQDWSTYETQYGLNYVKSVVLVDKVYTTLH